MSERGITEDEKALVQHCCMWGSKGYPVRRLGGKWAWGPWRSIQGPPTMFRTKREAAASFEAFYEVLTREMGDAARERAVAERMSADAAFKALADGSPILPVSA